ncbi:hypothetical protein M426DRAFT_323201, partial [Hypoxylon sp. CI-4A]
MAFGLYEEGWFKDVQNCLVHLDLEPRNILIDSEAKAEEPIITAVIDWDSAILAPAFMACKPPQWIWGWLHGQEEDERTANDVPETSENRELKEAFEQAAGPEYLRFAYAPEYRLARRLVRFAVEGRMWSSVHHRDAEKLFEEWESTHPPKQYSDEESGWCSDCSNDICEASSSIGEDGKTRKVGGSRKCLV